MYFVNPPTLPSLHQPYAVPLLTTNRASTPSAILLLSPLRITTLLILSLTSLTESERNRKLGFLPGNGHTHAHGTSKKPGWSYAIPVLHGSFAAEAVCGMCIPFNKC